MVLLGFLLTTFFGVLITIVFSKSLGFLERLCLGFGLGLGLQTLLMFFLSLLRIPLRAENIAFPLIILCLLFLFLTRGKLAILFPKDFHKKTKNYFLSLTLDESFLLFIIVAVLLYALVMGFYWPVADWDAIALYDFRAKVFAQTGFMDEAINRGYFFGYPLMTSMAHTWVYLLGGTNPRFIYPLFYLCFFALFYFLLREFVARKLALLLTALTATYPLLFSHSSFAYTNFIYLFYFVIGVLYLYVWITKQKPGYLVFSGLLVGLSTWTRTSEPFWLAPLLALAFYSLKKREILKLFVFSVLLFSVQQPWRIYLSRMVPGFPNVSQTMTFGLGLFLQHFDFSRAFMVLVFVLRYTVLNWISAVTLFALCLVLKRKSLGKHLYFWALLFISFVLLLAGAYIFSYTYPGWEQIPDSLSRLSIVFIPLLFYGVGLFLNSDFL